MGPERLGSSARQPAFNCLMTRTGVQVLGRPRVCRSVKIFFAQVSNSVWRPKNPPRPHTQQPAPRPQAAARPGRAAPTVSQSGRAAGTCTPPPPRSGTVPQSPPFLWPRRPSQPEPITGPGLDESPMIGTHSPDRCLGHPRPGPRPSHSLSTLESLPRPLPEYFSTLESTPRPSRELTDREQHTRDSQYCWSQNKDSVSPDRGTYLALARRSNRQRQHKQVSREAN